ncbi:hypothetical protein ACA910_004987 [Epithemia clementina (nom. ined.)]
MPSSCRFSFVITVAVVLATFCSQVDSFSGSGTVGCCHNIGSRSALRPSSICRTLFPLPIHRKIDGNNRLQSSKDSSDNNNKNSEEDEISKLIGRRSQIKRKKKEAEPEAQVPLEPVVDLDLDKLPEFKTERPVRRAKQDGDENSPSDEGSSKDKDNKSKIDVPIIDFKADFEDENEFHITNRLGVTTNCWGDTRRNFVASGKLTKRMLKEGKFVPGDLQLAHNKLLAAGITLLETSPAYGKMSKNIQLSAEHIVKRCIEESPKELPESVIVESLGTSAWLKLTPSRVVQSLYDSVELLGTSSVELFQVPKSFLYPTSLLVSALAAAIESGYCNHVGVQGVTSRPALAKICNQLEAREMSLTSNAFEFSLTNPRAIAMFDVCKELNVIPLVLNPLDNGLASGVYTAANPSGGQTSLTSKDNKFSFKQLEKLQPLHSIQESIAERVKTRIRRDMRQMQDRYKPRYGPPPKINTDITTTQVAINYVIAKGGVPLVEVNSPKDAEEVIGSLGWTLTEEEVDRLDTAAALCKL